MCHANNEKWKTTNDCQIKKNQNDQKKGNLQILGNIGSEDERKKLKNNISVELEDYSKLNNTTKTSSKG